ncbi:hypothetical protein ACHAXR_005015 [Thalassiosira sp. AJA248-18]
MSAVDNIMSTCAACGEDGDGLKACTACRLVKYCNVTCQKAHRPKHKNECTKRAAEIFDEALFKTPPPNEDCPICCLRLPLSPLGLKYQVCCGKMICLGCAYEDMIAERSTEENCPFCRVPAPVSDEEALEKIEKRIEVGDANAMRVLGHRYYKGDGVPQDSNKALELYHQAAMLGCAESHYVIGGVYFNGKGVEKDVKKAKYHWELAAMGGDVLARHNLGEFEANAGNKKRAMKHFMISAELGSDNSLKTIQNGFSEGLVTKDEFEKALRAHKESKDEMQNDQRDAARRWLEVLQRRDDL